MSRAQLVGTFASVTPSGKVQGGWNNKPDPRRWLIGFNDGKQKLTMDDDCVTELQCLSLYYAVCSCYCSVELLHITWLLFLHSDTSRFIWHIESHDCSHIDGHWRVFIKSRVSTNILYNHLIDAFLSISIVAFSMFNAPIISSAPPSRAVSPSSSTTAPTAFSRLHQPLAVYQQLSDVSHLRLNADIDELPVVVLQGKRYVKEEHTHRKRKRNAWVKDHGIYLILLPEKTKTFWLCRQYDENHKIVLLAAASTNSAQDHMKDTHRISDQDEDEDSQAGNTRDVLHMQRQAARGAHIAKTKHELFRNLLIEWIVDQNVPLAAVDHESFRNLLTVLAVDVDSFLPKSSTTVQKWLIAEFDKKKLGIKQQLHEDSISKIHLTFDMWTSDNQLALLGIVAHYLDGKKWKNQSRLLALIELEGSHSGENMAAYVSKVVEEYEITDKIGFFTLDNAKSNDTCLQTFLRTCLPSITDKTIKTRRIRCFGHVVNLAAKAFLFGQNADAFEIEDNINMTLGKEIEEKRAWRTHGPVGKLHNLATWIKRTPQRMRLFKQISLNVSVLDDKTKYLGIIVGCRH